MRTALLVAVSLMTIMAFVPAAEAAPGPEPNCMPVYRDYDYGIVRYQSPNSCEAHVWVAGYQIF